MNQENIVLGCLFIKDGLSVEEPEIAKIYARQGRELTVRLPYEYRHSGGEWDGYTLQLRTWLNDQQLDSRVHNHRHSQFQGDLMAYLEVKYDAIAHGEHVLRYEIHASYQHGARGHPEANREHKLSRAGEIKVATIPSFS